VHRLRRLRPAPCRLVPECCQPPAPPKASSTGPIPIARRIALTVTGPIPIARCIALTATHGATQHHVAQPGRLLNDAYLVRAALRAVCVLPHGFAGRGLRQYAAILSAVHPLY
jgi:hypothetical protein